MNCATLYSGSTQSLVALMGSFSACEPPLLFLGGNSKEAQTPWQTDALVEHSQARIEMAYAGHCDFLTGDFNAADESLYVESMNSCLSNKCQKTKIQILICLHYIIFSDEDIVSLRFLCVL